MIRLDGHVVLVTGAGRGLGAAHARALAARGATVVVHDAGVEPDGSGGDDGPATGVAAEITAAGGDATAETQNLATREGCEALVTTVLDRHGKVDALVHSAGLVRYGGIAATSAADWTAMLAVNVEAPWWLCRAVWPGMVERSYGRIVLTVSGYGLRAFPGSDVTAYGVGKAAQLGLVNGLAGEGAGTGIRVNAISPVAATRIFRRTTQPGELSPDDVAPGVVALTAPGCRCTGVVLGASGGEWTVTSPPRRRAVRPAANTPEAVLALLPDDATDEAPEASQTVDDAALETERHRFWTRLRDG
jgi:NAD(P)-dependent dehydrogenase (short-subunit alcohol dehydrogenase family)